MSGQLTQLLQISTWREFMSSGGSRQLTRMTTACARALIFLLCLPATIAHSLPDDRDQPIHITADKALRNEVEGVTIYSGNVELVQGSMELEADTLTIYHTTETADKIIATGSPAKMRQQPELDKGIVHAHAKVITYFKSEDRVHLQTDARIEQEGAVVDGDAIDYFIAKQLITAESDQSQENNKVVVVIPPSPPKEDGNETPQEPETEENTTPPATQIVEEGVRGTTESE
jgi:lipopolysaccharide export system protein LptA